MESEGRRCSPSIDGPDALAIAAICGVTCKPVNLNSFCSLPSENKHTKYNSLSYMYYVQEISHCPVDGVR